MVPDPTPPEPHCERLVAVLHKLVVALDALALIATADPDTDTRAMAEAAMVRILRDSTVAALLRETLGDNDAATVCLDAATRP